MTLGERVAVCVNIPIRGRLSATAHHFNDHVVGVNRQ